MNGASGEQMGELGGTERARRLFFALWPDPEALQDLLQLMGRLKAVTLGRWTAAEHLHLTLVFLGTVEVDRLPQVLACAAGVRGGGGELLLDRIEYWPRPKILCLTTSVESQTLNVLVEQLIRSLRDAGFRLEQRPFRVHVTLARKVVRVPSEALLNRPIRWPFSAFSLVESVPTDQGPQYRILQSWPLSMQAMPDVSPMK